jgi:tRNA dimethylallyltransferase
MSGYFIKFFRDNLANASLFFSVITKIKSHAEVYVVIGPTASGKSSYGIKLAQSKNGEIISCDSRQIYKGLEIFSGATISVEQKKVRHHLVSFLNPPTPLTAQGFVDLAVKHISEIQSRDKTPIVVGGTGYWAQALLYESDFPTVKPNDVFRETLHGETTEALFAKLEKADPVRAEKMDPQNRKRIVRALEIIDVLGHVPAQARIPREGLTFRLIYIRPDNKTLKIRIEKNVRKRLEQGLLEEARNMKEQITREQALEIGLGYKHIFDVLDGTISEEEFIQAMIREEYHYAKRQKTFCNKLFKNFYGSKKIIDTQK